MKAKTTTRLFLLSLLFITVVSELNAQFIFSGQYRPRAEYRHGFSTLPDVDQDPAFFIDQRARINLVYLSDKYEVKFIIQDVRTWGSQSQLVTDDGNLTTLHEGWAKIKFDEKWFLKMGRQEIIYDDQRIFGNVGWLQQARSHDAAIGGYNHNGFRAELALAFNQDGPQVNTNFYSVPRSYKTLQSLWMNKKFNEKTNASFLFLNLGQQGGTPADSETFFSQTIGGRIEHLSNPLKVDAAVYLQTGEDESGNGLSAILFSMNGFYTLSNKHILGAGFEFISGNDQVNPDADNQAFNPFFGTNHKFNGLMDYFYVGNHINSVGLKDLQFSYGNKLSEKWTATAALHFFYSDGEILDPGTSEGMDLYLGTELDITTKVKLMDDVTLEGGYSQIFASESMEELKGGSKDETSNWGWVMITFNPHFFTFDPKKKD